MRYNGSLRVRRSSRRPCSAASYPTARQNPMHELSLCRALVAQVSALAAERGARAVSRIRLVVGPLAGDEIALLKNAYPVSSRGTPAAGKTALLEATADALHGELRIAVIEGDLATDNDARRLRAKGIPAEQITTGHACHLDAAMVH